MPRDPVVEAAKELANQQEAMAKHQGTMTAAQLARATQAARSSLAALELEHIERFGGPAPNAPDMPTGEWPRVGEYMHISKPLADVLDDLATVMETQARRLRGLTRDP